MNTRNTHPEVPLIVADSISVHYGAVGAVTSASLSVRAGETVALLGRSGSGKSTMILALGAILPVAKGVLSLDGTDLARLSARERASFRRTRVGLVFQGAEMLPELSLLENVALPLEIGGMSRAEAMRAAATSLEALGIDSDTAKRTASRVSGGQAQRAAVARALAHTPDVVLADEPTGALDSATADIVAKRLISASRQGAAVVIATHDRDVAARADRIVEIVDGVLA